MRKKTLGIAILTIGIIVLAFSGFKYVSTVIAVDFRQINENKENTHTEKLPPIIGGVLLVGGILIILSDKKVHI